MIIKANTCVVLHLGKPAVKINDIYFFVDEPVGTMGVFLAHKFDQFAYLKEDSWEERSERNHYLGIK
jgi:hypothetical protein